MRLGSVALVLAATAAIDLGSASPSFAAGATNYVGGVDGGDNGLWLWIPGIPFFSEGGFLTGAPAIAANPQASSTNLTLHVVTGRDHNLYVRNDMFGYKVLNSGPTFCLDNPAAVIIGTQLEVACQGSDHALYSSTGTVSGNALPHVGPGWTRHGGILTAGPAVAPVGTTLTFFVTGTGGHVYTTHLVGSFVSTPWVCIGHPAAANDGIGAGTTTFACDGTDHTLWSATSFGGSAFSTATSLGGVLMDGPAVAADAGGVSYLVEGSDHAIYQRDGTASSFTNLGGFAQFGVGAAGIG